ncbi:hypothetical protein EDD85DRAFT_832684 [Armillaria nabsnona]|nr:hypothetical protein EDD85DRAFT_832684 [Armillaria nabsnona]
MRRQLVFVYMPLLISPHEHQTTCMLECSEVKPQVRSRHSQATDAGRFLGVRWFQIYSRKGIIDSVLPEEDYRLRSQSNGIVPTKWRPTFPIFPRLDGKRHPHSMIEGLIRKVRYILSD